MGAGRLWHIYIIMYSKIYRKFILAGALLVLILLIGSIGYWLIGGRQHSALDVLYMTFITITTIGFSEIIDFSSNPAGRAFTIVIAVTGIGVLAYMVTNVTALLVEGELTRSFRRVNMEKKARNSRNHYIICGMGAIGKHIADEMDSTGRPYVIVDKDQVNLEKSLEVLKNHIFIAGDATDEATLLKAGIMAAKGLFAATGDDNQNLVISLTARQVNPAIIVVARCSDTRNIAKMRKAGASSVISPDHIGGLRMASEMIRPTVVSFLDIMLRDTEKNLRVEEVTAPAPFNGKSIKSLGLKDHPSILLMAVRRDADWIYNPPSDYSLKAEDRLVFMATSDSRRELENIAEGLQ